MNIPSYSDKLNAIAISAKLKYTEFIIDYHPVEYGNSHIHVFFLKTEKVETLFNTWRNINSWFAGNFQTELKSEFETWNLYLLFLTQEKVNPKLKYQIENDTFSSRKIVIEELDNYDEIITNYITNNNLEFDYKSKRRPSDNKSLEHDFDLQKLLKDKVLKEKKNKHEALVVFNRLVKLLKSRENEV